MSLRDLVHEATAGMLQRPARTFFTMLGTVVGVGAFVAVLGLSSTAAGQVSASFSLLKETMVTVGEAPPQPSEPDQDSERPGSTFPVDADSRVAALNGVTGAGVWWPVPGRPTIAPNLLDSGSSQGQGLTVIAATAPAVSAMELHFSTGITITGFSDATAQRVAVISKAAATRLNIHRIQARPVVFIAGIEYLVTGIYDTSPRIAEPLLGIIIPASRALNDFGNPDPVRGPAQMLITTRPGAARQIAREVPLALDAANTGRFIVVPPADPHRLYDMVSNDLASLYLALAAICLVIGAISIANATLIGVLERTGEIGLRRSLGARPRHIAAQFLTESGLQGTIAGLVGTALGIAVTVTVAISRNWSAIIEPALTLPAPLLGTFAGLAAGAYPAIRAARTDPVQALRA